MSVREMDALCRERGIEFDPENVPVELAELAQRIAGQPAWEGHSSAQAPRQRRVEERRRRREGGREWFPAQDGVWGPWERRAAHAA